MLKINRKSKELSVKIVYCGAGNFGKASCLSALHSKVEAVQGTKTEIVSIGAGPSRTAYFCFAPVEDDGAYDGCRMKVQVIAHGNQVIANSMYELVLRDVDGIVFVVDPEPDRMSRCHRRFEAVHRSLRALHGSLHSVPYVIQYNKRDLPAAISVEKIERTFNIGWAKAPSFVAAATRSKGIVEPFDHLLGLIRKQIVREAMFQTVGAYSTAVACS